MEEFCSVIKTNTMESDVGMMHNKYFKTLMFQKVTHIFV